MNIFRPSLSKDCLTNEDLDFHTNSRPPPPPLNVVKYAFDAKKRNCIYEIRRKNVYKIDFYETKENFVRMHPDDN